MSILIGWFIVIVMSMGGVAILVAEMGWEDAVMLLIRTALITSAAVLFCVGLGLINGGTL